MSKYLIKYIDKDSHGKWRETYLSGDYTEEEVIDFFGLENDDVYDYEIIKVD